MTIKNFVKTSVVAFFAAMTLVACSDDDKEKAAPAEDAKMLTFGFYQEDNADVLSKDYVAVIPAAVAGQSAINIALPSVADKSSLVARFTINDGNTITVGGVAQVSQTTANDFTAPVDYIVTNSNGKQNIMYTVTVTKSTNMDWSEMAVLDAVQLTATNGVEGAYSGAALAINPKDNNPYIAFGIRGITNKLSVAKNVDGQWALVGQPFFSSEVNGSHYAFDIAADGTPYVAFADQETTSTLKGSLSVMKFDGTNWGYVGDQGFFKVQTQYVGLAAVGDNLAIDLVNNSSSGSIARRAMGVATYNGQTWTTGESSLLASGQGVYYTKMGGNGKAAVLISVNRGVVDNVNYGHNIFKFENGQWTELTKNYLEENASQTSIAAGSFGATIALDGTVYAWTGDDADASGIYQVRLKKYDAANSVWKTVAGNVLPLGQPAGFESHVEVDVAIAPDGTPFVAFNNYKDEKKLYVMYLDQETNEWSTPKLLATGASDIRIKFARTGKGFISYTDATNNIHVFQFTEK